MSSTLNRLLQVGKSYLTARNIDSPQNDCEELLRFVLRLKKRSSLFLDDNESLLTKDVRKQYFSLLKKRGGLYPLQYMTGEVAFLDYLFDIEEGTLIPRPETELLVSRVSSYIEEQETCFILDVGTGSGAIALSFACLFPFVNVVGVDISDVPLALARRNAKKYDVFDRAWFIQSDCFSGLDVVPTFDIIVSNPPYIKTGDLLHLPVDVQYEPQHALDGGEDGLIFYERICREALPYLKSKGILAFEVGADQGVHVSQLMMQSGFTLLETVKDYNGIERVVIGRKQ